MIQRCGAARMRATARLRTRGGAGGSGAPWGPRCRGLGQRGNGRSGSRRIPPSPSSAAGSFSALIAHQTRHSSMTMGIFNTNISHTKPQVTAPGCYPFVGGHMWLTRVSLDRVDVQVAGRALGLEPAQLLQLEGVRLEPFARGLRNQHLAPLCRLRHPGRDVDVHAEVVAADAARTAEVQARAQRGLVPVGVDAGHAAAGVQRRLDARLHIGEDGHDAVAEALDHAPLAAGDRPVGHLAETLQELDRGLVAGLERPGREADEVDEQDPHLLLAAPAPLCLGQRLPDLQRAEPELAGEAGAVGAGHGQAAGEQLRRVLAGAGERIAEVLVAGKELAGEADGGEQARRPVAPADPLQHPVAALLGYVRSSTGTSTQLVMACSSATRSRTSSWVRRWMRSVPNSSTLKEASAVP